MEFVDDYDHQLEKVMYFPNSFPTKDVEILYQYNIEGCDCELSCKVENNCPCANRSGTTYSYKDILDPANYSIRENKVKTPTYECNSNCKCKRRICGNKLVQFGPRKGLKVQVCDNKDKGLGLFTLQSIRSGNFVCEYAGEIITEHEARERYHQHQMNYIFCINETFGEKLHRTFIDPTYYGNIGRYINHSCTPNCELYIIRVESTMPILGIFAKTDIEQGTEITYDYGESGNEIEKTVGKVSRKDCYCNSVSCRKVLPFDQNLA